MQSNYTIPLSHKNEPFLDTIKAYCILWVVFAHVFPYLLEIGYPIFGAIQVPLFFMIQAFHFYKNENYKFSLKKIIKRVMLPFMITLIIQFICLYVYNSGDTSFLSKMLLQGGYGPGSYYPWCYIQFAVLLLINRPILFSNMSIYFKGLIILLLSLIVEYVSEEFLTEYIYRLTAFRYIFLCFIGYIWARYGIVI